MLTTDHPNTKIATVSDFSGGMSLNLDPSQLGPGQYYLLINGRSRNNKLRPVKLPKREVSTVGGLHQGLFAAGSSLIVLIDGVAYYRDFASSLNTFTGVGQFPQMDKNATTIWGELVPASTINYVRKASENGNPDAEFSLTNGIDGTPRALVLQDGFSRPRLIEPSMNGRVAQTFGQWKLGEIMEYVPVGKMMKHVNGKLYIVSASCTEIYHSLRGRPLDFVISVDTDGNKLSPEFPEEAMRLSHKVDYEEITCLNAFKVPTDNGIKSLLYAGTSKTSYIVSQDVENSWFGEAKFAQDILFSIGPRGQDSFVELLGDYGIITDEGIRLFNSVIQSGNEGTNAPLTLAVQPFFEGIVQDSTACINFDNYGLFAVNTIYGHGILVYDYNRQVYVALDIYPGIGAIKQFAQIKVGGVKSLWFITADGLYEAFAGSTATMEVLPMEYDVGTPIGEHRLNRVQVVLQNIEEAGSISAIEFSDRKKGETRSANVAANYSPGGILLPPFGSASADAVRTPILPFSYAPRCRKLAPYIKMNFMAELLMIHTVIEDFTEQNPEDEKAKKYE